MRCQAIHEGQVVTLTVLAWSVNLEGFYKPWLYRNDETGELIATLGRIRYVQENDWLFDSSDYVSDDDGVPRCSECGSRDERKIETIKIKQCG